MLEPEIMTYEDAADKQSTDAKQKRMSIYLEWMLTPVGEREPRTKRELAKNLGISHTTLSAYDKDLWLQDEYMRRSRGAFRVNRFETVLDSLYRQAIDTDNPRSVTAAGHLLKWVSERVDVGAEKPDLATFTPEELADLAVKLMGQANGVRTA